MGWYNYRFVSKVCFVMNPVFQKFRPPPLVLEALMKIMAMAATAWFAVRIWDSYQLSHNPVLLLMLAAETLTMILIVAAKFTDTRNFSPIPVVVTMLASFYFFVIGLDGGLKLIPDTLSAVVMVVAILWQIYAKIYLGRSFGLLPACRTVVETGPYRIVRHPIYLGYFVAHMGFLLNNFSWWNVKVFALLYLLQFCRIHYEEQVLSKNPQYVEYKNKVKYRFIPFVI